MANKTNTKENNDKFMNSETVVFHGNWRKSIEFIPPAEQLRFIYMVIDYGCFKMEPSPEDIAINPPLWAMIKMQLDGDKGKREERIMKNREAKERYNKNHPKKSDEKEIPDIPNDSPNNNNNQDNVNDNEIGIDTDIDTEGVNVSVNGNVSGINNSKEYLSNQNNISSSSSSSKEEEKIDDDDDDDDEVLDLKKKNIIDQCVKRHIDSDFASQQYDELKSLDFIIGGKPITHLLNYIETIWKNANKARADSEKEQKQTEENTRTQRKEKEMQSVVDARWNSILSKLPEEAKTYASHSIELTYISNKKLKLLMTSPALYQTLETKYPQFDIIKDIYAAFPKMKVDIQRSLY